MRPVCFFVSLVGPRNFASLVGPGSLAAPATRAIIDLHGIHDHHTVVVAPAHLVALVDELGSLQLPAKKAEPSAAKRQPATSG